MLSILKTLLHLKTLQIFTTIKFISFILLRKAKILKSWMVCLIYFVPSNPDQLLSLASDRPAIQSSCMVWKHFFQKYLAYKEEYGRKHLWMPHNKARSPYIFCVHMTEEKLSGNKVFTCRQTLLSSVSLRIWKIIDNCHEYISQNLSAICFKLKIEL